MLFWTGLTGFTRLPIPDNPVNPVNLVSKTPFVLSPPTRTPTRRNEQRAARPNAVSERHTECSLSPTTRATRERRTTSQSDAASPHRARRMTTDWNSSFIAWSILYHFTRRICRRKISALDSHFAAVSQKSPAKRPFREVCPRMMRSGFAAS